MSLASNVVRELLENGAHFGHQTSKWNPKMKEYIFGEKSGIYIIDLEKTEKALLKAEDLLYKLAREGKKILYAGTKKQAKEIIKREAVRAGMFYVDERWLGGCLTNLSTIRKSIERLKHLEGIKEQEYYKDLAKKEKVHLEKEEYKLLKNLKGIRDMADLPAALVIVDSEAEKIAVKEARKMKIPIVGIIDTNCDPGMVDYPIPANDDAIRSINYICTRLTDAIVKGIEEFSGKSAVVMKKETAPQADPKEAAQKATPAAAVVKEKKEEPKEAKAVKEVKEEKPSKKEKAPAPEESPAEADEEVSDEDNVEGDINLKGKF